MSITFHWHKAVAAVLGLAAGLTLAGPALVLADVEEHECLHGKLERAERSAELAAGEFDEATGRDLRNFPPDRMVDFHRMKLEMRFEDLNDQKFTAIEDLTFTPIGPEVTALKLNAVNLKINSVKLADRSVEFSTDGKHLTLRFDPALTGGKEYKLVIDYVCDHPLDGMFFTPYSPDAPHYSAEVHTQGQTETNRHWFVAHDYPNERMATELIVNVPQGFSVSSNGKLVSNLTTGDRSVWHYVQEKPHVSYLVSLVIGKFDIVKIPHPTVPMQVWVPQGLGDQVMQTYGRTGEMIDLFADKFGVAYPWDRYDQLVVKNFGAGGMENTSVTSMYPTAIYDEAALLDSDLDGLIAHELAHQWTGDFITCKGWAHIWLNEGWATYGSAMWNEKRFGYDAYLDSIRGNFGVARRDRTTNDVGMVSSVYSDPDETFRRAANPYPKGASILHMLRTMLGDDVFWKGVKVYMNRHALGTAETNDFRYAMEEVSGLGLEWFFEQWCYRPGSPELDVKSTYDGETRELLITVEQKQKIDALTPAFRFTLPVLVRTSSNGSAAPSDKTYNIDVNTKSTTWRTVLDAPPVVVAIDPHLHVLKTMNEDKPLGWWVAQVNASGMTSVARHAAIEAIGKTDSADHIALLNTIIRDENERYTVRNAAVSALASYGSPEAKDALLAIVKDGVTEARVRSGLVDRLRRFEKDQVAELLVKFASSDPSYDTRVAAIEGLASLKVTEQTDLIAQLVEFKSQHDKVRNAALRALADLDDPRSLDLAIKYAAYGHVDRSRPTAIGIVGRAAKHDKDRAVNTLLALLNDPEPRSISAAGNALVTLRDDRAIEPIRAMSQTHRDPVFRTRAEGWLTRLTEQPDAAAAGAATPPPAEGEGARPSRRRMRTTE